MADENSRYNVSIILDIRDATTGEPTPFSRTVQEYFNMKYEYMQNLQAVAIPALAQLLLGMGKEIAEEVKAKRGEKKEPGIDKFAR
jgi:hypothetical protein